MLSDVLTIVFVYVKCVDNYDVIKLNMPQSDPEHDALLLQKHFENKL